MMILSNLLVFSIKSENVFRNHYYVITPNFSTVGAVKNEKNVTGQYYVNSNFFSISAHVF